MRLKVPLYKRAFLRLITCTFFVALPFSIMADETIEELAEALRGVVGDYRLLLRITSSFAESFMVARAQILRRERENFVEFDINIEHARDRRGFCLRCDAHFDVTACADMDASFPAPDGLVPGTLFPWAEMVGNLCNAWRLEPEKPHSTGDAETAIAVYPVNGDWVDWDHSVAVVHRSSRRLMSLVRRKADGSEVRRIKVLDYRSFGKLRGITRALFTMNTEKVLVETIAFESPPIDDEDILGGRVW